MLLRGRCKYGALVPVILLAGCGDFFAHKPTELETRMILSELQQIKENPNVNNPVPELYRRDPEKVIVEDGVKVFYFTRCQPADRLAELVNKQFSQLFKQAATKSQPQGKEYPKPIYTVSANPATNQLIIHCPNDQHARKVLEFLEKVDVPPIQVNIDCLILERFADVTMDWETTIEVENLLGEKITLGGKVDSEGKLLPAFPGASLREPARASFGLDLGYWKNQGVEGHEFRAVVDMLISRGYLKILMNPTIETVNGKPGKVTLRDNVPLQKLVFTPSQLEPVSMTEYQWVEDILEVTPHVYADGSIGLETKIQLGSKSKPEGVVQREIITERRIEIAENRIKPGDSLVIGGIRKSEERAVVRGVPFLKDIPLLGILFSSKDVEEKATEVIFVLTPSISSGGIKYADMVRDIKQKRSKLKLETDLHSTLTDPFGANAYLNTMERKAARAELEKLKAQIEKAEALEEVERIEQQLRATVEQIRAEQARADRSQAEAEQARAEAEKLAEELKKIKAQIERASRHKKAAEAPKETSPDNPAEAKSPRKPDAAQPATEAGRAATEAPDPEPGPGKA